jgi:hypothetical protein
MLQLMMAWRVRSEQRVEVRSWIGKSPGDSALIAKEWEGEDAEGAGTS